MTKRPAADDYKNQSIVAEARAHYGPPSRNYEEIALTHRGLPNRTRNALQNDFRKTRELLGLTQQDMSSLTGISIRKISGIERGEHKPDRDDLRRINEIQRLQTELTHILEADAIGEWLQEPNEYFLGLTPIQVIQRGESDRVWRLIWRLQDGVPLE
ncbi:MAG: helix-turn-helix domain-containing protein [Candidatus Hydrogenedentes bacterium]|nr:helix-turn-helix domain-containing protein [Candidatus Hydrogenedentota bacterium]